jgi:hypothetical protein
LFPHGHKLKKIPEFLYQLAMKIENKLREIKNGKNIRKILTF